MTKERNPIALDFTDELLRYSWKEPFPSRKGKSEMYRFGGGYYSFDGQGQLVDCHYYIQDYQGNNRMVVNGHTNAIEQISHYYPYGALMGDISTQPEKQSFKYSGKELDRQFGLDLYDFHARQYDPAAPWFCGVDKKSEEYYWVSPYAYCLGNPVNNIDPDGRRVVLAGGKLLKDNYAAATSYLCSIGAGKIIDALEQAEYTITITMVLGKQSSVYKDGVLKWNPYQGVLTNNGYVLNPAEVLNHEADHAQDDKENPEQHKENSKEGTDEQYGTKEEKRAIEGSEQETARKTGKKVPEGGTRNDHIGYPIEVENCLSSIPKL